MFAGAKATTNANLLGRTKRHVQYSVHTEIDCANFHIHLNFEQLPKTAQFIPKQPVTNSCRLLMIDADNKAVKPFGEIHPSKFFQEYLDSNCLNQMDLAQRMGIVPKKANLQRKHDVELARKRYKDN